MKARTPIESEHALEHWLRIEADKAVKEAHRGLNIHGPMMSMHEGCAILLEEVEELWHELRLDKVRAERIRQGMIIGHGVEDPTYTECIQIAAVALRLAIVAHKAELAREAEMSKTRERREMCEARR